jgi:hypothetical protein
MNGMIKNLFTFSALIAFSCFATAQSKPTDAKLVIVVMDGYRWQELFQGADSTILFSKEMNKSGRSDHAAYWDANIETRKRKLMPFVWGTLAKQGQIFGDRDKGNLVNLRNTYWFSYPGRSEIFAGYFDPKVNSNEYPDNPNTTVLEYLNQQPAYKGKVAAFSSWDAVSRIMARKRSGIYVNINEEDIPGPSLSTAESFANANQHLVPRIFGEGERIDAVTYAMARSYVQAKHPKIIYLDLGDTDEFAHAGKYDDYLDAGHHADGICGDLWNTLQMDPFYKGQTYLLIVPDHGRGIDAKWTSHGEQTPRCNETYFMAMGPGIAPKGVISTGGQLYQEQYAQTIAKLLGYTFKADHPIAEPVKELFGK